MCLLPYRQGKLVDKREYHFEGVGDVSLEVLLPLTHINEDPAFP